MFWDETTLNDKDAFDQPSHTCASFKVANVCLHRANDEWVLGCAVFAKQLSRSLCLLDIADLGAGSMALHVRRPGDVEPRIAVDAAHILNLAGLARKGDTYDFEVSQHLGQMKQNKNRCSPVVKQNEPCVWPS